MHETFNFDGWCSETWVGTKVNMVLEMSSENRQCRGRRHMGGQLIPDTRCSGWRRFCGGPLNVSLNDADMVIEEEDPSDREVCILEEFEQGTVVAGGAVY